MRYRTVMQNYDTYPSRIPGIGEPFNCLYSLRLFLRVWDAWFVHNCSHDWLVARLGPCATCKEIKVHYWFLCAYHLLHQIIAVWKNFELMGKVWVSYCVWTCICINAVFLLFRKVYKSSKSLFICCASIFPIFKFAILRLCPSYRVWSLRIDFCSAFISSSCALDFCCSVTMSIETTHVSMNSLMKFDTGDIFFAYLSLWCVLVSLLDVWMKLSCDADAASIGLSPNSSKRVLSCR